MLKWFIICFIKHKIFEANERDLGPKKAHFQSNQLRGLKLIYIDIYTFISWGMEMQRSLQSKNTSIHYNMILCIFIQLNSKLRLAKAYAIILGDLCNWIAYYDKV